MKTLVQTYKMKGIKEAPKQAKPEKQIKLLDGVKSKKFGGDKK